MRPVLVCEHRPELEQHGVMRPLPTRDSRSLLFRDRRPLLDRPFDMAYPRWPDDPRWSDDPRWPDDPRRPEYSLSHGRGREVSAIFEVDCLRILFLLVGISASFPELDGVNGMEPFHVSIHTLG